MYRMKCWQKERKIWTAPKQNLTGYLKRYAQHVTSGSRGAVFEDD